MLLANALNAAECKVISLVGSGGKTSLMYRLASELVAAGKKVVTTTTTHILMPTPAESPECLILPNPLASENRIRDALFRNHHLTLAAQQITAEGKLQGYAAEMIDCLAALDCIDTIIVEADGAGRKPLKACAPHEPVIADRTDLLIAVAGLDGIGKKVAESVFRPEIFCTTTGLQPDDPVTPKSVAKILHSDLEKSAHSLSARTVIVLNKADDDNLLSVAEQTVTALSIPENVNCRQAVVVRLAEKGKPIRKKYIFPVRNNKNSRVGGIILAAGRAQRMGKVKALLPFAGSTVLQNVVETAEQSCLAFVCLVLGHEAEQIQAKIVRGRTSVIHNENYGKGQSSSLQAGLADLPASCEYGMFLLGDQPLLLTATIDRLLAAAVDSGAGIIVPEYRGRRGNPVLVHRSLFPQIHDLSGDVGARPLLNSHEDVVWYIPVDDPGIVTDIDTPEDYVRLSGAFPGKS